jgi:hypothetical protein
MNVCGSKPGGDQPDRHAAANAAGEDKRPEDRQHDRRRRDDGADCDRIGDRQ